MKELPVYKDFTYGQDPDGKWFYVFPSKLRGSIRFNSEEDLKKAIDLIVNPN